MAYNIVSADCHLDSEFLPRETFTSRVAAAWKHRVPLVVDSPEGAMWMANGTKLGPWGPKRVHEYLSQGERGRAMVAAGFDADQLRPADPALRIEDQEIDGVDAEVLYGPLRRWRYLTPLDAETAAVTASAYNEYLAEFCKSRPGRLFGLGGVPPNDVEAMVKEIEHIAALGLVGAEVPVLDDSKPLFDASWEPLWETAASCDVPVHIHINAPRGDQQSVLAGRAVWLCTAPLQLDHVLAAVIFSGALERHPSLKVVLAESGTGWIPYLLDRLDYEWQNAHDGWQALCETNPSELFKRQMFATFQEDNIGPLLAHLYPDNFMWGSDYPHPDGIWPDSQQKIQQTMGHLDEQLRNKILRDNAARLYHIS